MLSSIKKRLIATYAMTRLLVILDVSSIAWALIYPLNSVLLLVILQMWNNDTHNLYFWAIGLWVSLLCQKAFFSAAYVLFHFKITRYVENFIVTPVHGSSLIIGFFIFVVLTSLLHSGIYLLSIYWLLGVDLWGYQLIEATFIALPLLLFFMLVGFLAALWAKKWDGLALVELIFLYPLIFLSGVFFAKDALAPHFQFLLDYNILSHYLHIMRAVLTGQEYTINMMFINGIILALLVYIISVILWEKGWKIKNV